MKEALNDGEIVVTVLTTAKLPTQLKLALTEVVANHHSNSDAGKQALMSKTVVLSR